MPVISSRTLHAGSETDVLRDEVEALKTTVKNLKGKDFISADSQNLAPSAPMKTFLFQKNSCSTFTTLKSKPPLKGNSEYGH